MILIQRERAGSHNVRRLLDREITTRQQEAQKVKNRITLESELSPEAQAIFYSDWMYTAIHALTSIEEFQNVDAIAERLALPRSKVVQAVATLLHYGLCKEQKGKIVVGPSTTFVDRDSPLANRHHANWRLKAIEKMPQAREEDFFFTAPFSVSKKDFSAIRTEIVRLIDGIAKRVDKSDPEMIATINLDFFQ